VKVAALDLGSNTFLLLVCEVEQGKITKIYQDEIQVTKLGQGVHANKKFHPEALLRAESCLSDYAKLIAIEKPDKVLAMATSAARDVSNGEALFKIGEKYNIPIRIIPGHLEAQITYEGATYDLKSRKGVCAVDVGGGSTEVIALGDDGLAQGVSIDVGSVRLTEMFVTAHPIATSEIESLLKYIDEKFYEAKSQLPRAAIVEVIGVAGTPTTLAAVMQRKPYSDEIVHGYKITLAQLEEWMFKLAALDLESRKSLVGMDPQRADVIVAGIAILVSTLRALNKNELTVSTRGVRYGVALMAARE
jgi:exopolyphosphatase / guanosine-5'-triphosphate,3'-diphosphate pyrophosphatase